MVPSACFHRLAERDTDILGGVMVVDVKVAHRLYRHVDARMPGQQVEHMVEKADAGRNVGHARPVEVHRNSISVSLVLRLMSPCA